MGQPVVRCIAEGCGGVQDVPPETQMLLLEAEINGPYVIMLPLIDGQTFRATLRPGRSK